ncbi:unnamed protein product, partial [Oncorhynchus mykiss]
GVLLPPPPPRGSTVPSCSLGKGPCLAGGGGRVWRGEGTVFGGGKGPYLENPALQPPRVGFDKEFFVFQFKVCPKSQCVSTPGHRTDLFLRDPGNVLITDFFGSVRKVEITMETINLTAPMVHLAVERPVSELKTESQSYVDQLPVAEIIHQKPKQRDWHPPDGFILGLWTLILLVFFKTYGAKHLKHIF